MIFLKKVNALVLGLVVLGVAGCGGDEPEPKSIITQNKCLLVKTKNQEHGGDEDRELIYNPKGQLTKITHSKNNQPIYSEVISYSTTGKITWIRHYHLLRQELDYKRQFFYNSDSLISKEVTYSPAIPGDSTSMRPGGERIFDYDNAKRLTKISFLSGVFMTYTYAPNNILIEDQYNLSLNAVEYRREIQYVPNVKAPGSEQAYYNLPPRYPSNSNGIRFGLLPVSIQTTEFYPGTSSTNTITWNYSYAYNSEGYPKEQIRTFQNQQPWSNYWIYNCQ